MSVATVTTDIKIGPYKIPSNGQNMIMNNYAVRKNLKVSFVIPEPIKSDQLATIQWCHRDYNFSKIILCSIYQLPRNKNKLNELITNMSEVEFHFALEGVFGTGDKFIKECYEEVKIFENTKKIDSTDSDWLKLFDLYKSN